MKKILAWLSDNLILIVSGLVFGFLAAYISVYQPKINSEPLKEFKDGIQNHLVWDIKGQCFFVRPNDENTVYLIRVVDCDKK